MKVNKKKKKKSGIGLYEGENARNNEREPAGWGPLDQHTAQRGRVDSWISTHNS